MAYNRRLNKNIPLQNNNTDFVYSKDDDQNNKDYSNYLLKFIP
jgi:hypothetical protein